MYPCINVKACVETSHLISGRRGGLSPIGRPSWRAPRSSGELRAPEKRARGEGGPYGRLIRNTAAPARANASKASIGKESVGIVPSGGPGIAVEVGIAVLVGVEVGVDVAVAVGVGVEVGVDVAVAVGVGVE